MLSRTYPAKEFATDEERFSYKARKYEQKISDLLEKMESEGKTIPNGYEKYMKGGAKKKTAKKN